MEEQLNKSNFNTFVCSKLRKIREEQKLTLQQTIDLAELNISKATLSAIETGKQTVEFFIVFKICLVFKKDIKEMLPSKITNKYYILNV